MLREACCVVKHPIRPIRYAIALAAMLSTPYSAARDTLLLAGYSGSSRGNYAYLGGIVPISSPYLYKDGFLLRLWLAQADFMYISASGQDTRGIAPEFEASLGYLTYLGDKNNRLSVYLGGVHRNARLTPGDPFSNLEEKRNGIRAQGDLALRPTSTLDFSLSASHTGNIGDAWSRFRPGYVFGERIILGPEMLSIRGDAYNRRRVGLSLESMPLGKNAELALSLGRERDRDRGTSGYAGLSLISWF